MSIQSCLFLIKWTQSRWFEWHTSPTEKKKEDLPILFGNLVLPDKTSNQTLIVELNSNYEIGLLNILENIQMNTVNQNVGAFLINLYTFNHNLYPYNLTMVFFNSFCSESDLHVLCTVVQRSPAAKPSAWSKLLVHDFFFLNHVESWRSARLQIWSTNASNLWLRVAMDTHQHIPSQKTLHSLRPTSSHYW